MRSPLPFELDSVSPHSVSVGPQHFLADAMAPKGAQPEASAPVNPDASVSTQISADKNLYAAFNFRTRSSDLREQAWLSMAKMRDQPTQRCPLLLSATVHTDDGFECQWKEPRSLRVAWMFSTGRSRICLEQGKRGPGGSLLQLRGLAPRQQRAAPHRLRARVRLRASRRWRLRRFRSCGPGSRRAGFHWVPMESQASGQRNRHTSSMKSLGWSVWYSVGLAPGRP